MDKRLQEIDDLINNLSSENKRMGDLLMIARTTIEGIQGYLISGLSESQKLECIKYTIEQWWWHDETMNSFDKMITSK